MDNKSEFQNVISIITPTYNSEKYIRETILSVLEQTYQNWEMVIVDDCSTDNTTDIVKELCCADTRIVLIEVQQNGGPAIARNIGLKYAKGRFIAFLDSDDLILPRKLELQLQFMQEKDAAIAFTSYRQMSEDGDSVGAIINAVELVTYEDELHQTLIGGGTVLIDREKTGAFKFENARNEDFLLWLTLLKRHNAYGLQIDLARYRKLGSSRSSNKISSAYGVWKIYRNYEKLNFTKAVKCFLSYAITSTLRNYMARSTSAKDNAQNC